MRHAHHRVQRSARALSIASFAAVAASSFAQYGIYGYDVPVAPGNAQYRHKDLYLGAEWTRFGGSEKQDGGATISKHSNGALVVLDYVAKKDPAKNQYSIVGGWAWLHGDEQIYEAHVKHFFQPDLGVQVALNKAKGTGVTDWSLFLLKKLQNAGEGKSPFMLTVGGGAYIFTDTDADFTGVKPTFFIQVSGDAMDGWHWNASFWYIQTPRREGQFDRLSIGVGKRF